MTRSEMDSNDLTRLDLNDVSRFIDQTMDEPEHDRAVAHLSTSDADAELVADVTYMLGDLEAQDGVIHDAPADTDDAAIVALPADAEDTQRVGVRPGVTGPVPDSKDIPFVPPSTARTRSRRLPARWLALAAVLAGMMLIPLALSRTGGDAGDTGDFAVLLANRQAGLPNDWIDKHPWTRSRGGGSAVIEDALAARLGALNTDLALSIQARQAEQTQVLAGRIVERLDESGIGGVGVAAAPYRQIAARAADEPSVLAPLLAQGRDNIADFVGGDAFHLGAWAEAARIAADQRDVAFFRTRDSRRMLNRAATLESLDEETRTSIDALGAVGRADGQPDWTAVRSHADQLLSHLAR